VLATVNAGTVPTPLVPHPKGHLSLRVPATGRFDSLELAFRAGRFAPQASSASYVDEQSLVANGPWSELITLRLRHPLSVIRVVDAADALRRAVLSLLGDDAPASVHGHSSEGPAAKGTHVAWVGLPNLSPYSKGELIGLGVALPREMASKDRARCLQALLAVTHVIANDRRVEVEPPTHVQSLQADRWMQPARRWRTVTPVVLDRFPKKGKLTAEAIVIRGLIEAGYPEPLAVRFTTEGALGPWLPSGAFRLRRQGRLYSHVEIEFGAPLRGPLLVGAERHFGLGLCLPG
jgi:CRISPR-associated protein Csb2